MQFSVRFDAVCNIQNTCVIHVFFLQILDFDHQHVLEIVIKLSKGRGKKNRLFLGKSPKLWVGGGQDS